MINKLPEDILWEITKFLRVQDYLNAEWFLYIRVYYTPSAITIQRWYRKYKKSRDNRYRILYNEFQKRNEKMYDTFYANIFFSLYDLRKLRKRLNEYHFYSIMEYYLRESPNFIDLNLKYKYTLEKPTYTNLKKFLKELPPRLILRT